MDTLTPDNNRPALSVTLPSTYEGFGCADNQPDMAVIASIIDIQSRMRNSKFYLNKFLCALAVKP
jgi:hypothetical protein